MSERILLVIALGSLAVITLWPPATSRMYAVPGSFFYWTALLAPGLGWVVRLRLARGAVAPALWWSAALLGLAAVVILSGLQSPHRGSVLRWSMPWLSGIALFGWAHAAIHSPDIGPQVRRALGRGLAVAFLVVAAVSLANWLGQVASFAADLPSPLAALEFRNAAPLGHANYTAGAALVGLPWVWRERRQAHGRRRLGWGLGLLLLLAVLFTSGSRGGLIGLAAVAVAQLLAERLPWQRLLLFGVGGLVLAGMLAGAHPRIRALLQPADPAVAPNLSSVQRLAMTQAAWAMGGDRPLLGWGLHATPLVYPRYRAQLDGGVENALQVHSTPLEIWAGLGGAGVLAMAWLSVLAGRARTNAPTAAVTLAGYAAFSLTDYQLDVPLFVAVVALCGALLAPARRLDAGSALHTRLVAPVFAFGVVALVLLVGRSDPAPAMNVTALHLARNPAETEAAGHLLEASLALNPAQEIAHFNLGWLRLVREPESAARHFAAAAQLVPDKGGVYFGLGLAWLNLGQPDRAVHGFALECLNDPAFLRSPWWNVPPVAALAPATRTRLTELLEVAAGEIPPAQLWRHRALERLSAALPELGAVPPGPIRSYRRVRTAYPVLHRNHDLPAPQDLFDVQESVDLPPSWRAALPAKGWLPAPLLLKLLDRPEGSGP